MAKIKSTASDKNVMEFIDEFADTEQKKKDSYALLNLMSETTGMAPYLWGSSIISFGSYHYKYASGHEGDAPIVGFSPRKAAISLYTYTGAARQEHLLDGLGKFKMGKACIYIKKLADIDQEKLKTMIRETMKFIREKYPPVSIR